MLTVKDCLSLPLLADATLVAGAQGLDRFVELAHVVDIPDVGPWVAPGVLLLTTGYGRVPNQDSWLQLVEELNTAQAAGLLVAVGRYVATLPPTALRIADQRGLPVAMLPWDLPFVRIIEAVHHAIIERQTSALHRIEGLQTEIARVAVGALTLRALVERFTQLLERPVMICEPGGEVLAGVGDPEQHAYVFPLRWDRAVAHTLRIGGDGPLTEVERHAAEHMALVATLSLFRELTVARTEARLQRSLLDVLLQGQWHGDDDALVDRAQLIGFRPTRPSRLVLVRWPKTGEREPPPWSWFDSVHHAEETLRQRLKDWHPLVTVVGEHVVAVMAQGPERTAAALTQRLAPLWSAHAGGAGLVGDASQAESLVDLYRVMTQVAAAAPPGRVSALEELLVPRLLTELPPHMMAEFWEATWARLTSPVHRDTLSTFVEHFGHHGQAAAALGIHRNTLRNRLEEVEGVLGQPVDGQMLWQLSLAWFWHRAVGAPVVPRS